MKIQLNGWQRLWVFLSVIYIIPVAFVVNTEFDNVFKKYQNISYSRNVEKISQENKPHEVSEVSNGFLKEDFSRWLEERNKHELSKIDHENYYKDRNRIILMAIFCWAVPIIAIYVLGWSIGWIYQGFKES